MPLLDKLRHPLEVGTVVITSPYRSSLLTYITKIVKVNKKSCVIELPVPKLRFNGSTHKVELIEVMRKIARDPTRMIAVEAQVAHNKENFPEYCV